MIKITNSSEETKSLAQEFAQSLKDGEILALVGDLGAGKTTFTQGLAEFFGIAEAVSSPTYTLIQEYELETRDKKPGIRSIVHIDCYRLDSPQNLLGIGIQDYFDRSDIVIIIEWADKIREIIPPSATWITIEHNQEQTRTITIN